MKLTRKTEYAFLALIYLAENYNKDYSLFDNKQMDVYFGVFNKYNYNQL